MDEKKLGLTIKQVSERTEVSVHTLRAWERRYGVPSPNREAGNNYRSYDDQDVADVMFMKQQVEKGVLPAQASALLRQQRNQSVGLDTSPSHQPIATIRSSLIDALSRSEESTARQIIDQAFALFAPETVALQVIEPAMREVGDKWVRNEMTVWQEHLASNLVQQKLFSVLQSQPPVPLMLPHLIAACAPSEEHQIGLVIFTLLARQQGWRTSYLGQGTPLIDLLDLSHRTEPDIIAISITTVIGLKGLIPWLDAKNRPSVALVFGGQLPNLLPSLREHLPGDFLGEDTLTAVRNLTLVKVCENCWAPTRRAWNLTNDLLAHRLKIAGEVSSEFMAGMPANVQRKWDMSDVHFATLYLIDAVACALAFDSPGVIDLQREWLNKAMPPRAVMPRLLDQHFQIIAMVLRKNFSADQMRLLDPLVEQMKDHG